jgi:hypothetical protein
VANWPTGYSEPTVGCLTRINEQTYWDSSQATAAHRVNESRLKTIDAYRGTNNSKARVIKAALVFENRRYHFIGDPDPRTGLLAAEQLVHPRGSVPLELAHDVLIASQDPCVGVAHRPHRNGVRYASGE